MQRIAVLLLLIVCVCTVVLQAQPTPSNFIRARDPIPGRYIVSLSDDQFPLNRGKVQKMLSLRVDEIGTVYNHALVGVVVSTSENKAIALARLPFVKFVEEEGWGELSSTPTTAIDFPGFNAKLEDAVTVTASASDDGGVTRVEFYRAPGTCTAHPCSSAMLKFTDYVAPYEWAWDTRDVNPGQYTLWSKAYDAASNVGTSQFRWVEVVNTSTWHIDRVARRLLGDLVPTERRRPGNTGSGVDAYIIDNGVWGSHTQFGTRVQPGRSFAREQFQPAVLQACGTSPETQRPEDPLTLEMVRSAVLSEGGGEYSLTLTGTGTAWDTGASSSLVFETTSDRPGDGYVSFRVPDTSKELAVGLNDADVTASPDEMEWSIRFGAVQYFVYEGSVQRASGAASSNSEYRIEKCDSCVPKSVKFIKTTAPQATLYTFTIGSFTSYHHVDFSGKATIVSVQDIALADTLESYPVYAGNDPSCSGLYFNPEASHGTSVASVLGGGEWGIAPGVNIVPVRVGRQTGGFSKEAVLDGVDWIIRRHVKGSPAVANASFFFAPANDTAATTSAIDVAFSRLVADGVFVTPSANNQADQNAGLLACIQSPSRVPRVVTVGATKHDDSIWIDNSNSRLGSNTGTCVDIYAPGHLLRVADHVAGNNSAYRPGMESSGTSFAAPVVAGVAALYLQVHTGASPITTWDFVRTNATDRRSWQKDANNAITGFDPIITGTIALTPTGLKIPFAKALPLYGIQFWGGSYDLFTMSGDYFPNPLTGRVEFRNGGKTWWNNPALGPAETTLGNTQTIWLRPPTGYANGVNYVLDVFLDADLTADDRELMYSSGKLARGYIHTMTDLNWNSWNQVFRDSALRMVKHGISTPSPAGSFDGESQLTRAHVAPFIVAAALGGQYPQQMVTTGGVFGDIAAGISAETDIFSNIIEQGGKLGLLFPKTGTTNYVMGDPVTRYEMAKKVLRAKYGATYQPKPALRLFADADDEIDSQTEGPEWAEQLYREGVTGGCGLPAPDGRANFCGDATLTRLQMAVFLSTVFDQQCAASKVCPQP
jgi:hypothetical protein